MKEKKEKTAEDILKGHPLANLIYRPSNSDAVIRETLKYFDALDKVASEGDAYISECMNACRKNQINNG